LFLWRQLVPGFVHFSQEQFVDMLCHLKSPLFFIDR
jgi:hypothetical protein